MNFSHQDMPAVRDAYYDRPEFLTPTDAQLASWRLLLLAARGMEGHKVDWRREFAEC